jgi:hypothetical protein
VPLSSQHPTSWWRRGNPGSYQYMLCFSP